MLPKKGTINKQKIDYLLIFSLYIYFDFIFIILDISKLIMFKNRVIYGMCEWV